MKLLPLSLAILFTASLPAAELFPFVPPWDDATPGATNISAWLDVPAGKDGFVTVRDGHLFAGGKRLRFLGVNMAFGGNFPTHDAAEKIAGRLAKFGINCVRFHHMDMFNAPAGIFAKDGKTLDPERLDRLDYFVAQLKARGIYTNLNLHVSRTYPDRPKAEKGETENYDKGVDNFVAAQIALQKDFARDLLTHVNPYTKTAYAQEPAVALIEINNENALLFSWQTGALDKAAPPYRAELAELWTKWLDEKYGSREKIAAAWRADAKEPGPELLKNGGFASDTSGWMLEQHQGAAASAAVAGGVLRVEVKTPGQEGWHVQFNQAGLKISGTDPLEIRFRARADVPRKAAVTVSQAHAPWQVLASETFELTTEWQPFKTVRKPSAADDNARLSFALGSAAGAVEIDDVSLHAAGIDGSVPAENGRIVAFTKSDYAARTETAQRDWYRFLWTLEERYWPGMYAFIREELKAKPLILGTQLFWSPFPIQSRMDVIDSHAYWQHPHFPGKSWDMANWTVKNDAMTGAADGGTIPRLALQRVAGKPYLVTEYNHSAPNTFSAETFPLICAYGALQDWDGIFAFAYSHRGEDWDKGYFPSFFDIDQHPTKMATLAASAALFMRGDVAPAQTAVIASMTLAEAVEQARKGGARIGAEHFGRPKMAALIQRVGVQLGKREGAINAPAPVGPTYKSDTDELSWDTVDKVVTVDTAKSKAVIGFGERRSYDLGGVKIDFGALNEGFGIVQLTVLEGANFAAAKRILITATATAENTGMQWTSDKKDSVGKNWGKAPSLVEGVPAKITFPGTGAKLKAWALDERGQRRTEVPIKAGVLEIGPEHRTLWYELAAE